MPTSSRFHVYHNGAMQLVDARVSKLISFAHIGDLYLPPHSLDSAPPQYRRAIDWWDTAFRYPHQSLLKLFDDICTHGADFVFLGGDIFDYCDPETVQLVIDMCKDRNLPGYFQICNHDREDENGRPVLAAIEACPTVLSTFIARHHFRSEDALGRVFQFMTAPGYEGQWRYVNIDSTTPPKSLRIPGQPVADLNLQS